jgi:SAM-dependent methyltransferase
MVLRRREDVLADHIGRLLPRSVRSVLDVGCGDGVIASTLVRSQVQIEVEGAEILERPECAIPCKLFDGVTLPYPDASFDAVMLVDVLHHADDLNALLSEAARVSRKFVIIKDHTYSNRLDYWVLSLMDWVGNRSHGVKLTYGYLRQEQWLQAFHETRLVVSANVKKLGLYPFPFSLLFESGKHFVAALEKTPVPPSPRETARQTVPA